MYQWQVKMPKCQQQVMCKKKKVMKRCGNNAMDGCDFCHVHNVQDSESEVEMDQDTPPPNVHDVHLLVPPVRAPPPLDPPLQVPVLPLSQVPVPPVQVPLPVEIEAPAMNAQDLTLMFNSILTSLTELKITVDTKKKPKPSAILKRAKMAFYHDIKKDHDFRVYVANLYNPPMNLAKIPWQIVKEKSDQHWEIVDQSIRDSYFARASII